MVEEIRDSGMRGEGENGGRERKRERVREMPFM